MHFANLIICDTLVVGSGRAAWGAATCSLAEIFRFGLLQPLSVRRELVEREAQPATKSSVNLLNLQSGRIQPFKQIISVINHSADECITTHIAWEPAPAPANSAMLCVQTPVLDSLVGNRAGSLVGGQAFSCTTVVAVHIDVCEAIYLNCPISATCCAQQGLHLGSIHQRRRFNQLHPRDHGQHLVRDHSS